MIRKKTHLSKKTTVLTILICLGQKKIGYSDQQLQAIGKHTVGSINSAFFTKNKLYTFIYGWLELRFTLFSVNP